MKRKVLLALSLVLACLTVFSSVGFGLSSVPVKRIWLSRTSITMAAGATRTLIAYISPVNASNKTVKWSSGNISIAKVNAKGMVTAVKNGSATITAKSANGKVSVTCYVIVSPSVTLPVKKMDVSIWFNLGLENPYPTIAGKNLVMEWLTKKTGVTPKGFGNGGQEWKPKLTQMIAGDTLPDLMFTAYNESLQTLVEGNYAYELTPAMIKKYAPNMWRLTPQWAWDDAKVNGKIYGIPNGYVFNTTTQNMLPGIDDSYTPLISAPDDLMNYTMNMAIRDDILKKLVPDAKNLTELEQLAKDKGEIYADDEIITSINSTEKFVKLMNDIKALNLKEGGKPVYTTGYPGTDNWFSLCSLGAQMLGYNNYFYWNYWDVTTKSIKMGYSEKIFHDAAKIQNKMIRDKVIDPESLVQTTQQFNEKVANGRYALVPVVSADTYPVNMNGKLATQKKSYRYVNFITNIPNRADYPVYQEPSGQPRQVVILKTVKEADLPSILRFLDTSFQEDFEDVYMWGPADAGIYKVNDDGTRAFIDQKFQDTFINGKASLKPEEKLGIQMTQIGYFMFFGIINRYNNKVINHVKNTDPLTAPFKATSPHIKAVNVPQSMAWDPIFQDLDLVKNAWTQRDAWDTPFKTALTAGSDEEFEAKWSAAIKNMDKILNTNEMLKQMTERARKQAAELRIK